MNVRYHNGNFRRKCRARFKAMQAECGICHGLLGAIDYECKSDARHPLSFVIDEIVPVSKAHIRGYANKKEAVKDWGNLQAAHWICNAKKSNKMNFTIQSAASVRLAVPDGEW